jgi:hypothetical protein
MEEYMATESNPSFFAQAFGIFLRRLLVFTREPRQWFMILAPFLNVIAMIALIYTFFELATNGNE